MDSVFLMEAVEVEVGGGAHSCFCPAVCRGARRPLISSFRGQKQTVVKITLQRSGVWFGHGPILPLVAPGYPVLICVRRCVALAPRTAGHRAARGP